MSLMMRYLGSSADAMRVTSDDAFFFFAFRLFRHLYTFGWEAKAVRTHPTLLFSPVHRQYYPKLWWLGNHWKKP
ncbi:hypothetical protein B296_00020874 [Ensete ventricosum]|uniref:Uncharacterized protein n=1 Tax=Ensete ventricosum TaxID=4639 RepID=A0A426ZJT6_ENSVE|nr:hypothetical protein B296_00020874 [Ensete ventricosum]